MTNHGKTLVYASNSTTYDCALAGRKKIIKIAVFETQHAPARLVAAYPALYAKVFQDHHPYLNAINMDEVLSKGNGIAFASAGDELHAAFYYNRMPKNGQLRIKVMGLVSSGEIPGLAAPLLSTALIGEIDRANMPVAARAIVRVMPTGDANIASAKTLTRAGFVPARIARIPVTPSNVHLLLNAEDDNQIMSLEMIAGEKDILASQNSALKGWAIGGGGHV